jgi:hypothetical protein
LWNKAKKALGDAWDDALGNEYGCWNCYFRAPAAEFRRLERCPVCGTSFLTETENEEPDTLVATARRLGIDPEGKTRKQIQDEILALPPKTGVEVSQPGIKEVFREREIITREIVKIRCRHCSRLFEEKSNYCPHCGAPL